MHTDRILGVAAIAVAAIMLAFGYGLEAPFAYEPTGPRAFPLIAAGMIALCGVILVWKLAYALLFQPLGFVVATTVFMIPIAMIFGAKWWQGVLVGAVLSVSSFLLFDRVLDVVLPTGPLGGII
jgi:putative tricarboxylic transport membrane protein